MNIVVLKGNLARDPEIKVVNTGNGKQSSVVSLVIAVNRFFKKANGEAAKEATFIPCEAWDTGAETIAKYCSKGDELLIEGCIKEDRWEVDGQKRSKLKIRINNFELQRKQKNGDSTPQDQEDAAPGF
jgi:single-strand DNA-binding protein